MDARLHDLPVAPSPSAVPAAPETPPPEETAEAAGLRYVNDDEPGISRRRTGKGFTYWNAKGGRVTDAATLERIRALAIPPAWTDVWICADADGHIQATGRDAEGRKQYKYHARFREARDTAKFERILAFAHALPRIRERVEADLKRPGLPREKVLAAIVKLLEQTLIRVGNADYTKNQSFGLTTLRDRHVRIDGAEMRFQFRGKSGRLWNVGLNDRRVAKVVRACQDVPGQHLFQYVDDEGERRGVGSADVNAYLKQITGADFTAKDFRTWAGTHLCAAALAETPPPQNKAHAKRAVAAAIRQVSRALGNTPAVCRSGYVHPSIISAWEEGRLDGSALAKGTEAECMETLLKEAGGTGAG
ncbi:MAG TPA: DNA topoisomerase IB [Azospirillaceae bacterium]|nr:DNA topoisomerase IB [Azospirillaceae bacterium]